MCLQTSYIINSFPITRSPCGVLLIPDVESFEVAFITWVRLFKELMQIFVMHLILYLITLQRYIYQHSDMLKPCTSIMYIIPLLKNISKHLFASNNENLNILLEVQLFWIVHYAKFCKVQVVKLNWQSTQNI